MGGLGRPKAAETGGRGPHAGLSQKDDAYIYFLDELRKAGLEDYIKFAVSEKGRGGEGSNVVRLALYLAAEALVAGVRYEWMERDGAEVLVAKLPKATGNKNKKKAEGEPAGAEEPAAESAAEMA